MKNEHSATDSYMEALKQTFLPALSESETTHWFSTDEVYDAMMRLRGFLFERVYRNPEAKSEEVRAKDMLRKLYEYFIKHPEKMPADEYSVSDMGESVERRVCDYIAGMTDRYAISVFENLFIPKVWKVN